MVNVFTERRDIENVDTQLVQLVVLVSTLPTMPGMIVLVDYSVGEMRPMVATALPALDWVPCTAARVRTV